MRTRSNIDHVRLHSGLVNVGVDDHHLQPSNIEVTNTTQVIPPLPGGPGVWDISVPLDAQAVLFSFQSDHTVAEGGGKAGLCGVANRSSIDSAAICMGGWSSIATGAYNAVYAKSAATVNLSHKIWTPSGNYISLTDAYLTLTSPTTRVFRTQWTNYGASNYTLWVKGEIQVFG